MNKLSILLQKEVLLALGAIVFVGAVVASGTGAFFSSQASATANVFTAGTLTLKIAKDDNGTPVNGWLTSQSVPWNLTALTPGGTPEESAVWLKNEGSVDGMTLGVAMANAAATVPGTAAQMRITEMTLDGDSLLEGGAGHNFALYEAPTSCDIEVNYGANHYTRISAAVNAATAGQVICVGPGNYSNAWEITGGGTGFPIQINQTGVKVVSIDGPAATTVGGGFAINGSNVTLSGFRIAGESTYLSEISGVYVSASATGSEVSFNELIGVNTPASRGIITAVGASIVSIKHNDAQNWATGIYLNPSTGMIVRYNTLTNNIVGASNDNPTSDIMEYNHVENNSLEGIGVYMLAGNSLTLQKNNIFSNGVDVAEYGDQTVVAQNNWWGSFTPASQVTGSVDTTNFAGGPFAGFINGNDWNGNGYADLQDLNNDPILGTGVGLDAGEQKQFVMAVQLDGPTTGNNFQGASLTTDLVFTLNQI
jgi:predicted ribosomally synthesized peptide with SipW-like signal peptide